MFTVDDLLKDGFLSDVISSIPKCELPCTEHEAETRRHKNCGERNTNRTLPVERGGTMDKKRNVGL